MQERSKIYNFRHQKNVTLVKEMDLSLGLALTDVLTVVETVELDLIKVFLQFNKHVLNVLEAERKLPILAQTVMDKEILKPQKKYLSQYQKGLMMEQELDLLGKVRQGLEGVQVVICIYL